MDEVKRSIFRTNALQRYRQRRDEAVLPRLISPHTCVCLWILLGLLITSGLAAWGMSIPLYASGVAIVMDGRGHTREMRAAVVLIAFLPPQSLARLQVGQPLLVQFDPAVTRTSRPIMAIEPEIIGPAAVQQRFGLSANAVPALTQPAAVVLADVEPLPAALPASASVGRVYGVDVEIGSRRVLSLLPLIGALFGE